MKKFLPALFMMALSAAAVAQLPGMYKNSTLLPNGWKLTPAGKSLPLGDLPLNMAVSPLQRWMVITNNGQSDQSLQLMDVQKGRITDSVPIAKSWYGITFGDEHTVYASGGNDNRIWGYHIINNKLKLTDSFILGSRLPAYISPAGIAADAAAKRLYTVTREDSALYIFNATTHQLISRQPLNSEGYACLLSPDKMTLYISCWGSDKVKLYSPKAGMFTDSIPVGDNPNELCLNRSGTLLYVANSNDNSVSVIDTKTKKVIEVLNAALHPADLQGSTTNGLALSADGRTLYIANADNNCLAVFDVTTKGASASKGFIPTGWYPTNVKVIGSRIYVTNGKGFSSMPNPFGPNPVQSAEQANYQTGDSTKPAKVQYIAGLFRGTLSIINKPSAPVLSSYSRQVYQNTPLANNNETIPAGNPLAGNGIARKIKYVFYIIKENRTYDQVMGDVAEGAGDPSLVLFGRNITPNQHRLAKEFVLLDNFYCNAEVSADGHNWSMGGYATDYLEKTWPTSYGGRGGRYDAEGNRAVANNKDGFIWDDCQRAGVSYRTYGEFADGGKPNIATLKNHVCAYYTSWDQKVRDTSRFYQWRRDFDSLLHINKVPQLNTLRMINDHTEALKKGRPTPFAHVADNDLAVGLLVEYLAKSVIWDSTAIFILEDDAQNGADHIDAHRSPAFIAGGFVKRGVADHTMYTTTSVLKTIEDLLGLKRMSQYDATATGMWRCFTTKAAASRYTAFVPAVDLADKNIAVNQWQKLSEGFNLAKEDAVPDLEFNRVLWHGIKGDAVPFPSPRRAAFIKPLKTDDD